MGKGKGNQNTPDAYAFVMINIALNAFRPIILKKILHVTRHTTSNTMGYTSSPLQYSC